MNNVWTAIALRAPCVARNNARQPLLHLFNGYARISSRASYQSLGRVTPANQWKSSFSNNAVLHKGSPHRAKRLKLRMPEPRATQPTALPEANPSKLETAPTVATHTEGVPQKEELLTWRDYDPVGGMPLPGGERSQVEINGIFGSEELDADTGNYILNVMYWRRESGALIDSGINFPPDSGVSSEQALKGLEYIRALDPCFDEQAAGRTWAEEESLRLQEEIAERAVNLGLYKRDELAPEPVEVAEESDQGTDYGRSRNQDSALVRLRKENIARTEAEEVEQVAERERKEANALATYRGPLQLSGGVQPPTEVSLTVSGGITISRPNQKAWLQPVERKPWVKYYEERAQIIKENVVPQHSLVRRLGPSLITLLIVLALCDYLSDNYTPPPKSARLWPDTPPSVATLAGLTAALVASFIFGRIPPLWRTYSKYFTIVPMAPYSISLLGAIFRHDRLSHLLVNVTSLWVFGSLLHDDVGRGTFLAIFFASGAIGGFASLTYNILRSNYLVYIFGASGATLGVLSASCVLRPNGSMRMFGYEIPVAAWVFLGLYGAGEVVALVRMRQGMIDHGGHVGGILAGIVCGLWLRMKMTKQKQVEEEGSLMMRLEASAAKSVVKEA